MKIVIFILAIVTIILVQRKIQRHFAEIESSLSQQLKVKDSLAKKNDNDLSSTISKSSSPTQ